MNRHESVSVIIPTYNRAHLLRQCLDSIVGQTYPVSQILIIDDGSIDSTREMVQSYVAQRPAWKDRIEYVYQENKGQSAALNHGIAKATGRWIARQDSDDLWLPQKLEWQFRALQECGEQAGLCFTDAWFMNNSQMKTSLFQLAGASYLSRTGLVENHVELIRRLDQAWTQTVVVRADLVRQAEGLDERLTFQEDQEFLFRLSLMTKFCYVNMPMVLIDRSPAEQRHAGVSVDWHDEEFRLRSLQYRYEKSLSQHGLSNGVLQLLRSSLRQVHSSWANLYLRRGDYVLAGEAAGRAASYERTWGVILKLALIRSAPWLVRRALTLREQSLDSGARREVVEQGKGSHNRVSA